MANSAAVLVGVGKIVHREVEPPEPPPMAHAQIRVRAVGICGSDLAYYKKGQAGGFKHLDFSAEALRTGYCGRMGHECAGEVLALGDTPTPAGLKVGDRVALEPGVPCSTCRLCRSGRYNLCPTVSFIGSAVNETPGALVECFNHPAAFCHKLPDGVSLEEGAMVEPLCVALHATRRARVGVGQRVLVTGAGPIGLLAALAARAAGASLVVLTDVSHAKLTFASRLGFEAFDASAPGLAASMEARFGHRFDVCLECCGQATGLDLCVDAAESGGVVCIVANHPASAPARLQELARREIDLVGVYRYANLYPTAITLIASGKIDVKPLICERRFSLAEANEAFEYLATGEPIKVLIEPSPCLPCSDQ